MIFPLGMATVTSSAAPVVRGASRRWKSAMASVWADPPDASSYRRMSRTPPTWPRWIASACWSTAETVCWIAGVLI